LLIADFEARPWDDSRSPFKRKIRMANFCPPPGCWMFNLF
jgi:hypothetical protein